MKSLKCSEKESDYKCCGASESAMNYYARNAYYTIEIQGE